MSLIRTVLTLAVFATVHMPFAGFAVAAENDPGVTAAADARLQAADQLVAQGNAARRDNKAAQAIPLYEKALAIKEAVLVTGHATLAPLLGIGRGA